MISKEKVIEIAGKFADETTLFVVQVSISAANDIEVIVDSELRVSLNQCADLSKKIQAELDLISDDYSLMVASAGIGSLLIDGRQIKKTVGKDISVVLKTGEKIIGKLVGFDDLNQVLEVNYNEKVAIEGKKRKEIVEITRKINVDDTKSIIEELKIK